MYERGNISKLSDIFKFIPKTTVFRDLGYRLDRGNELIEHPEDFPVRKLFEMAAYAGLTEEEILRLMLQEYLYRKEIRLGK